MHWIDWHIEDSRNRGRDGKALPSLNALDQDFLDDGMELTSYELHGLYAKMRKAHAEGRAEKEGNDAA